MGFPGFRLGSPFATTSRTKKHFLTFTRLKVRMGDIVVKMSDHMYVTKRNGTKVPVSFNEV